MTRNERSVHWFWKASMTPAPAFVGRICTGFVMAKQAARLARKMPMIPRPQPQKMTMLPKFLVDDHAPSVLVDDHASPPTVPEDDHAPPVLVDDHAPPPPAPAVDVLFHDSDPDFCGTDLYGVRDGQASATGHSEDAHVPPPTAPEDDHAPPVLVDDHVPPVLVDDHAPSVLADDHAPPPTAPEDDHAPPVLVDDHAPPAPGSRCALPRLRPRFLWDGLVRGP